MVLGLLSAQSEAGQLGVEGGVNPFSPVLAVSAPKGMRGGEAQCAGAGGGVGFIEVLGPQGLLFLICTKA